MHTDAGRGSYIIMRVCATALRCIFTIFNGWIINTDQEAQIQELGVCVWVWVWGCVCVLLLL